MLFDQHPYYTRPPPPTTTTTWLAKAAKVVCALVQLASYGLYVGSCLQEYIQTHFLHIAQNDISTLFGSRGSFMMLLVTGCYVQEKLEQKERSLQKEVDRLIKVSNCDLPVLSKKL